MLVDNARLHRCAAVKDKRAAWKAQGLSLWFLPPYSPHLNDIEALWRKTKYHALQPADFTSFKTLGRALHDIFKAFPKHRASFA